jgi:ABC-type uncharacterized transport system substrate-binding protein
VYFSAVKRKILLLALLIFAAGFLYAHPHSWIDAVFDVNFDSDGIASISVSWKFDDFTASYLILDFDINKNKSFEASEIEALRQQAFLHLDEYHYYSYVMLGNTSQPVVPENFSARMDGKSVYYSFDISVKIPWAQISDCVFYAYDTSYYIYFTSAPGTLNGENRDVFFNTFKLKKDADVWGIVEVDALELGKK